jgi:16S rRNA (guanine1207-N2)-methyltransferase
VATVSRPDSQDDAAVTPDGHYFSPEPTSRSRRSSVRLTLADRTLELVTDRGVFSPDRVDPGTKLLLMEMEPPGPGAVLDLGCGYGPIACTTALRYPENEVWATDVNPRARELCELNAQRLGAAVRVSPPEMVPDDLRFGTLVSNPPIRIGKQALHALLVTWLDRLETDGRAWLVVNRNLGADSLAAWLKERGHPLDRRRSRQGYRILEVGARAER